MLRNLFVLGLLIPGMVAASVNRFAALLLYVWFALFRPQEWLWIDVTSLRLSLMIGLLLLVPSLATGIMPNLTHPLSMGAVAFMFAALLGQLDAIRPDLGWYWLDALFRLILVSLLAVTLTNTKQRFVMFIGVIAGSFGFHSAKAGLASLLAGGVRFGDGLAGAFVDNNGYAVGMAMTVPLLVVTAQNIRWKYARWGFLLAAALTAFASVSTFSRGGLLALITGAITLAILQRRRLAWGAALLVMAIPLGVFMATQDGYLDRIQTIQTYEDVDEASAKSRIHFWGVALNMSVDHPLGVGLFNFEPYYDRYDTLEGLYGHNRSVHSSHFQVLAEAGYLGALVWCGLFTYAVLACFRVRSRVHYGDIPEEDREFALTSANALLASMAAFVVGGAFVAMALNDLIWLVFALVASLERITDPLRAAAAAAIEAGERFGDALQKMPLRLPEPLMARRDEALTAPAPE